MQARAAQSEVKAKANSLVGSRRDGGIAERVVEKVLERVGGGSSAVLERGGRPVAEEVNEEDDDAVEARRERLRAVQRRRRQEEEETAARATGSAGDEEEEEREEDREEPSAAAGRLAGRPAAAASDDESGSSSYETDDDDDDDEAAASRGRPLLKPVFIAASARETVKEREALEAAAEAERERKRDAAARRQAESKALLVEAVRKEESGVLDTALEFGALPEDDDEVNELEEFDAWKLRELQRVRRERAERAAAEREKAELDRRRSLTDEQRAEEDAKFRAGKANAHEEKAQWKFLQKYYHKGAYFQDEDEKGDARLGPVLMRDYGHATGKDAIGDKAAMPAPMQVKNFGFRSQVKWTHLSNEDTSGFSRKGASSGGRSTGIAAPAGTGPSLHDLVAQHGATPTPLWAEEKQLQQKAQSKQAGLKGANDFDRPSAKRKR
ncbi:microfibrillar-associated protein [Chrysochromulina tobinii]|uniref:Microfibrillar-associated protein n=1 Tax=Chrysochromulina tobinii TaxID=1460289 RepID=A0A0M0K9R0_9EUKA|nr:microfibrillar-associated protein [Chrysochromulina tobinii]|eukprot:KOO35342.1 microfibrillar-associated protein [Chrysochromulina sp. CCMP291]